MIESELVKQILKKDESPVLEFKKQWYWDNDTPKETMDDKWGELIKDIISLSNGYIGFTGKDRYLIIGYSDSESKIYDIDKENIKILCDLRSFKKKLTEKIELYTSFPLLDFYVDFIDIDGHLILVFFIPCPASISELKKELKTKTRVLDEGAVLIRKGQNSDSIRCATPKEYNDLSLEFEEYKKNLHLKIAKTVEKKERSISKTIQLYINKNSSYALDVGYPKTIKDWSNNIVFELFRITESLGGIKEFLYIHEKSSQGKTLGYLKKNQLISDYRSLIILTEKPDKIADPENRKQNLSEIFGTKYVFFINEFGYEFLYKDCFLDYEKYNLPIYVDSLIEESPEGSTALSELKGWYETDSLPLLVVKGYGGIGKTTLVKQFMDDIFDNYEDTGLLFIDSNEIIDDLARSASSETPINDIYDFYKAQIVRESNSHTEFSKELLKLSVDNGSLLIVLDGIDEVIARLGSMFDINSFIKSIVNNYSSDLEKAKILITCRDHFWDSPVKDVLILEKTLKPFNEKLAVDFFNQAFNSESSKVYKAMKLARDFALIENNSEKGDLIYIPYALDMIKYLVISETGEAVGKSDIYSEILSLKIQNDFIVGNLCNREIKKLGSLTLDDQIKIFIHMSVCKEGNLSVYDIKSTITSASGIDADDKTIEKLKGHPLLIYSNNNLSFRYDFFNVYFKILYIADFFVKKIIDNFDDDIQRIICSYVKYDSSFTISLCERTTYDEDLIFFCMEIIEILQKKCSTSGEVSRYNCRNSISATFVFILCSLINDGKQHNNVENRTKLLLQVFSINEEVKGLCLINIFGHKSNKPIFDFRNKIFRDCYFEQFEYFWECPIDENTFFMSSTFKSLIPREGIKPIFFKDTFGRECDVVDIKDILEKRIQDTDQEATNIKEELTKFFRIFYQRGNFYPKKQGQIRSKVFTGNLLPVLLEHNVVKDFLDPKKPTFKQYKVSANYQGIINYLEQGGACIELDQVVEMFVNKSSLDSHIISQG